MLGLAQGLWELAQDRTYSVGACDRPASRKTAFFWWPFGPSAEYYRMLDRIERLRARGRHHISLKDITGDFS